MNTEYDIVMIEDNKSDSELMIRSLRKNYYSHPYILLEDGAEAEDFLFCEGKFDSRNPNLKPMVIFLDIKLPKISGLDILHRLKSNPITQNIPVVILTSSLQESDVEAAYRYGVNSYISKPVDFDEFCESMNSLGSYWLLLNEKAS